MMFNRSFGKLALCGAAATCLLCSYPSLEGGADPSVSMATKAQKCIINGPRVRNGDKASSADYSSRQQLHGAIIGNISAELGNARFLVFGTGFDSPGWMKANPDGCTIFIEHHEHWISFQPKEVQDSTVVVSYAASSYGTYRSLGKMRDEETLTTFYDTQVPTELKSVQWDVILVDSPEGLRAGLINYLKGDSPGRSQSIYAAKMLAGPNTVIFVDDCHRLVERVYAEHFLQSQFNGREMRVFDNGHGGQTCRLAPSSPSEPFVFAGAGVRGLK